MELKPGYKQTEVGVIPEDWEVRALLSAVRIAKGQVDPKVEPYRSMTLVAPDHIESRTGRLLERSTASDQGAISGKYLFMPGDIVYSKIRPYLRKAILADFRGLCSADMYPLTPAPDVSPAFMFAVLLSNPFSCFADNVSVRSGIPKINREELAQYILALPLLPEQKAIAQSLSDVDALITECDRLITKKRNTKQGTMQQLLTGKKRLPGFSGEWEVKRLGDILDYIKGFAFKSKDYRSDGVRIIRVSDTTYDSIKEENQIYIENSKVHLYSNWQLEENDLILSTVGSKPPMYDSMVGKVVFIKKKYDGCLLNQNAVLIRSKDKNIYKQRLVYYHLKTKRYLRYIEAIYRGNANQASITLADLFEFAIPLPSVQEEQQAIAQILSDMDAEIAALEQKRDKYKNLKQGMMQELLTGKTRLIGSC